MSSSKTKLNKASSMQFNLYPVDKDYYGVAFEKRPSIAVTTSDSEFIPLEQTRNSLPGDDHRDNYRSSLPNDQSSGQIHTLENTWYHSRILRKPKALDDLESWWIKSGQGFRLAVAIALFCFAVFLVEISAGIYLITSHWSVKTPDPYMCTSSRCQKASFWIHSTMDTQVNPCDNFYEFVCGNTEDSTAPDPEFDYLNKGGYPVQLGEQSLLANLLKISTNDSLYNQGIQYYQVCLNTKKRKIFGTSGILDAIEYVFGTQNFAEFENLPDSLEDIAARLMKRAGHASFINMAFFTYPFIQIQRPSKFATNLHNVRNNRSTSREQRELEAGIITELGVPANSSLFQDAIQGLAIMAEILFRIREVFNDDNNFTSKSYDTIMADAKFIQKMGTHFVEVGLCPPMGLQLDPFKVLRHFIEEDYRLDYSDLMAAKHFAAIVYCLQQNSSRFTYKPITHRKTAFVSLWIVEFFYQFMHDMDYKSLYKRWKIYSEPTLYDFRQQDIYTDPETVCLEAFFETMGYVPLIRYLIHQEGRGASETVKSLENTISRELKRFANVYKSIPAQDISTLDKHFGSHQLSQALYVDFLMPFVSATIDVSAIQDNLNFTEDHLKNSLISVWYSIERARMNWKGSTNPYTIIRWFGYGGGTKERDIHYELFDFRKPFVRPAPLQEKPGAGNGKGLWERFLKRKYFNYLLFPLGMPQQHYLTDYRAIRITNLERKWIRAFLQLIEDQSPKGKYTSLKTRKDIVYFGDPLQATGAGRRCYILDMPPQPGIDPTFSPSTIFNFSFDEITQYNNVLALRYAITRFRKHRATSKSRTFYWPRNTLEKDAFATEFLNRVLPGNIMSQYSEDQILLIATVRDLCRESWKTSKTWKEERWRLELNVLQMLTQTREFSEIWKCPERSFMNNKGYARCGS